MEPVTINLDGFNEFVTQSGPFGYIVIHAIVGISFAILAWRAALAAGKCWDAQNRGNEGCAYVWRAALSGLIGVANIIAVMAMSFQMFEKSAEVAKFSEQRAANDSWAACEIELSEVQVKLASATGTLVCQNKGMETVCQNRGMETLE